MTFPSITHALRAEKLLKEQGINVSLAPIPLELSSSCQGLAAQLQAEDVEQAVRLLRQHAVDMVRSGIDTETL